MPTINNQGIPIPSSNIWDINESIPIDVSVFDLSTGKGVAGNFVELIIQRNSDNKYWDGYNNWVSGISTIQMNEPDSVNRPGRYNFILPASANTIENRYVASFKVDSLVDTNGVIIHVSRNLENRFYELEPTPGC